jgi:hypothetical protein
MWLKTATIGQIIKIKVTLKHKKYILSSGFGSNILLFEFLNLENII